MEITGVYRQRVAVGSGVESRWGECCPDGEFNNLKGCLQVVGSNPCPPVIYFDLCSLFIYFQWLAQSLQNI